jgi:tripartite motif-containing protein 71
MTNSKSRPSSAREAIRIAGTALALALLAMLPGACRKAEKPGATSAAPEAATPATAPAPAGPDLAPHIATKADPGAGPFAGLAHARGIAVDSQGRVWIADFGHASVRLFDAKGSLFGGWGGQGDGPYAMKDPCDIAVHGDNVYVADTWRTGVERFSTSGELRGKAAADLYGPHGVAVAPDGRVYISDAGNNRILVCDADLSNPKSIGKGGAGPDEFASPVGIAVGPSGTVYVADAGNKRIQVIDSQGRFKAHWKINGWGTNAEPYLDVDSDETVYVSDPNGEAVLRLDRSGRETKRWTADDEGKKFLRPTGVAIDRKARVLYVVNTDADSVSRLALGK